MNLLGADVPRYSIIVLNWNGGEFLSHAVESVLRQTFTNFEVLIMDNGSTDESYRSAVTQFEGNLHVRLLSNGTNLGYCLAHNRALADARGSFIMTLNPDVVLEPDFLEKVDEVFSNPNIGMIAPHVVRMSNNSVIDSTGTICFKHLFATAKRAGEDNDQLGPAGNVFGVIGAYAVYDRRVLEDVALELDGKREYFDPDFFTYYDEHDLQLRARWRGWTCVYVPTAKAAHRWRHSVKEGHVTHYRLYHLAFRNYYLSMIKNMTFGQAWRGFPCLILQEFGLAALSLIYRRPIFFSTKLSAIRLIPRMWLKRRLVMGSRKISTREFNEGLIGFRGYIRFLISIVSSERKKGRLLTFSDQPHNSR